MNFKNKIRNIPDFPQKGVIFRDIAPLLEDKKAFRQVINLLVKKYKNQKIDKVVGIDARGFILAGVLAHRLKAGMVMVRKKGKLPFETESMECDLEYGKATLEIHKDSIKKNINLAKKLMFKMIASWPKKVTCQCQQSLKYARF